MIKLNTEVIMDLHNYKVYAENFYTKKLRFLGNFTTNLQQTAIDHYDTEEFCNEDEHAVVTEY